VSQAILLGRWWNTDRGEIWLARAYDHVELPPIKPVTTRINLHRADCRCCGNTITAEPPADMPPGSPFGPGIVALVTYLHGCQMVGYARLAEMLEGLFGLKISEGAIANMLARAAEPFAECAQTIHETVFCPQAQRNLHSEESIGVCAKRAAETDCVAGVIGLEL
jgi:transposase